MRLLVFTIAILISLPLPAYSQGAITAQSLRTRKQYRNTLALFREPQIFPGTGSNVEVYRVFVAPTFGHPISIRVEKNRDGYFVIAKGLSGQGGYRWGRLKHQTRRRLNQAEWHRLIELLSAASFWTLPAEAEETKPNEKGEITICMDGTSWYLEGVKGETYQAVDRECMLAKTIRAIGLYMVRLSKWAAIDSDLL